MPRLHRAGHDAATDVSTATQSPDQSGQPQPSASSASDLRRTTVSAASADVRVGKGAQIGVDRALTRDGTPAREGYTKLPVSGLDSPPVGDGAMDAGHDNPEKSPYTRRSMRSRAEAAFREDVVARVHGITRDDTVAADIVTVWWPEALHGSSSGAGQDWLTLSWIEPGPPLLVPYRDDHPAISLLIPISRPIWACEPDRPAAGPSIPAAEGHYRGRLSDFLTMPPEDYAGTRARAFLRYLLDPLGDDRAEALRTSAARRGPAAAMTSADLVAILATKRGLHTGRCIPGALLATATEEQLVEELRQRVEDSAQGSVAGDALERLRRWIRPLG